MLRSEAITVIKRGLGFRQTQDAAIIAALQQAQRDLENGRTLPNWMVVFNDAYPVLGGSDFATLPPGFIRWYEDMPVVYAPGGVVRVEVPRRNFEEAHKAYVSSGEPGAVGMPKPQYPQVFVQWSKTRIEFVPQPLNDFTLYLTYYKAEPVLSSEMENGWLKYAPNYLIGLAGVMVAGDVRDKGAMEKFNLMAQLGQRGFIGDIVEDELAGRALVMGRNN